MKLNAPLLSLMVALAAGSAAAAGMTPANTSISNIATASFIDPNDGTTPQTSQSNTVVTTVLPKPGFDVNFSNTTQDGNTPVAPVTGATSGAGYYPAGYIKTDVVPTTAGTNVDTLYKLVNNGNSVNPITLSPVISGNDRSGAPLTGAALPTVEYYLDNGNGIWDAGDTLITGPVNLPVDDPLTPADEGQLSIIQRVKVPTSSAAGSEFFVSPRAQGQQYNPGTNGIDNGVLEPTGDLQYTYLKIASPLVDVTAPVDTNPTTPGTQPPAPGTVPTTGGPVTDPNTYPSPANPTGPAVNPGTVVSVDPATGDQNAYPKADADTTPDVVSFLSQVTNNGTIPDRMVLTLPTGLPAGVIVTILDGNGNPIAPDANGNFPLIGSGPGGALLPGESVPFRVVVTYPDPDGTTTPASDIAVVIGVDSGNDPDLLPNATGTFTVNPPQVLFGDTSGTTADPSRTPNQSVVPGQPTGTGTSTTDSSAVFPMTIVNTGGYPESYALSGSVQVPLTDGTTATVPVTYYLVDSSGNIVGGPITTTPVLPDGSSLRLVAVVNIPPNAASTVANGTNTPLPVTQTLTGTYSGVTRSDNNDTVSVGVTSPTGAPGINIAKTQTSANADALPGKDLRYQIVAKNNFNAPVRQFFLTERGGVVGTGANAGTTTNLFTYTTFKSVSGTSSFGGNLLVRFNGTGSWQPITAYTAPATVTQVDVGVDNNPGTPDGTITTADTVPSGGTLTVDFTTTIK